MFRRVRVEPGMGGLPLGCHHWEAGKLIVVAGRRWPRGCLLPRDWLHRRQMTCPLSGWSCPPFACGVMWSGSALLGRLPMV